MIPPSAGYGVAGMSEIHGSATLDNSGPIFDATVTLKQASMKWGLVWPSAITDLNGTIRLTPGRELIKLTSLSIGSAQANFEGRIEYVSRAFSLPSTQPKPLVFPRGDRTRRGQRCPGRLIRRCHSGGDRRDQRGYVSNHSRCEIRHSALAAFTMASVCSMTHRATRRPNRRDERLNRSAPAEGQDYFFIGSSNDE